MIIGAMKQACKRFEQKKKRKKINKKIGKYANKRIKKKKIVKILDLREAM